MDEESNQITLFRSMDDTAKEDCEEILGLLASAGIEAVLLDDSAPGVPPGVFEVRVPAADAVRADQLIADNPPSGEVEAVDNSANLNLETIFHAEGSGSNAEMEAVGIQNLLEANGIAAILVGDSVLPNLPFEVRVARDQAERARQLIAEAEHAGPAEAERAELESEAQS